MPKLSPKAPRILRWLAFFPTVVAVAIVGLLIAALLLDVQAIEGDLWVALPPWFLCNSAAVYFGSRMAPSDRRWPIFLAAGVVLLVPVLTFLFLDAMSLAMVWLVTVPNVGAVAVGGILAWRRIRRQPLQAVRTAEGRSFRYKGTAPFQRNELDRSTFFGRNRQVRSLLSLVLAERLVVLFGKSGMGKSSLINAGLAQPLLERGFFPITVRFADRVHGPLAGILEGVRAAADEAGVDVVDGHASDLLGFFETAEFWSRGNDLLQPVLIFDQFEELFTSHAPAQRDEFIVQLAELLRGRGSTGRLRVPLDTSGLDDRPSKLKILLSLREDYLADLEHLARDIPGILQHRFRIGPLTAENAREAIVRPAMLEHANFETAAFTYREDALVRILTFLGSRRRGDETVKGDEVDPAQLQLVCQFVEGLVRTRLAIPNADRWVEVSEADLGDERQLQRVLEDFYDRTLATIGSSLERRRIQRLCERRLISGAGRRLTEAEEEIEKRHRISKKTLRSLVDTRLLRAEPRLGGVFYELSHDTLVEPILRSRRNRVAHKRRVRIVTAALLVAWLAPWWALAGRQNRARQQALAFAAIGLSDRYDPDRMLELPRARVRAIADQYRNAVRSREGYGAMMFAAEDVSLRYPELSDDVRILRKSVTDEFNRRSGLKPISREDDERLNRRISIAAGRFMMGSLEEHQVALSPFLIQEHEVTNEEYRRFDPNHDRFASNELPAVSVTWHEAMAYAAWLGGTLPTEAQWEFAARGQGGRTYPWGEEDPTCGHANLQECGSALRSVKFGRERGRTPEGVYDLAGNAWEWCRDWLGSYENWGPTNPLGPATGSARVVRGGSYQDHPTSSRSTYRNSAVPETRFSNVGFRVVWPGEGEAPFLEDVIR